jgi:hypothetical protein
MFIKGTIHEEGIRILNTYTLRNCILVAMPIILATWEAEVRRIMVQSQPQQIVCETLSWKNPTQNMLNVNKPSFVKQTLLGIKAQIDLNPVIVGNFNILL